MRVVPGGRTLISHFIGFLERDPTGGGHISTNHLLKQIEVGLTRFSGTIFSFLW